MRTIKRAQRARAADNKSAGSKKSGLAPRIGMSLALLRLTKCCVKAE